MSPSDNIFLIKIYLHRLGWFDQVAVSWSASGGCHMSSACVWFGGQHMDLATRPEPLWQVDGVLAVYYKYPSSWWRRDIGFSFGFFDLWQVDSFGFSFQTYWWSIFLIYPSDACKQARASAFEHSPNDSPTVWLTLNCWSDWWRV